MARVFIVPDDYKSADDAMDRAIEVRMDNETGYSYGECPTCGRKITDRGYFPATIRAIALHIDQC